MLKAIEYELELAKIIFEYCRLDNKPKKADAIIGLGSIDLLPAERAADLYLDGWSPILLFSGGGGRNSEKLELKVAHAEMMGEVAVKMGVPRNEIILETESLNTGDNIKYSRELLYKKGVIPSTIMVSHMPHSLRRDYATIKKFWPEVEVVMVSPRVPLEEYHIRGFQGVMSQRQLIADMMGDFQRVFVYPKKGFMIEQKEPLPQNVREAYYELVERGYDEHLLREDNGSIVEI